jgi:hypothetical protein
MGLVRSQFYCITHALGPQRLAAARRCARSCGLGGSALYRQQAFALSFFASQFAGPAYSFRFLAGALFGWLFVEIPQFHFAENALALHLFLQRFQGLVDVVVAYEDLQVADILMVDA